jgi:hypothetical protein
MDIKQAIMGFSQSEKIKTGIIWISQVLQATDSLSGQERQGAAQSVRIMLDMLFQDIQLAQTVCENEFWKEVEKPVEQARIMIDSGVGIDAITHLTRALSQVTTVGHRSMSLLKDKAII